MQILNDKQEKAVEKKTKMIELNQKSVLIIVCISAVLSFIPQIKGKKLNSHSELVMPAQRKVPYNFFIPNQEHSISRFRRSEQSTNNKIQHVKASARGGSGGGSYSELSDKEQESSTKGSGNYMSILSNPDEMLKLIAKRFNLDHEKLKKQVGQSVSLGAESIISPALAGIQIIEKVFVPDQCRLKLMCQAGAYVTARAQGNKNNNYGDSLFFKLQPKHIESSHFVRAFSEGHGGKDCEGAFPNCEPRLQKPYEDLMRSARETLGPLRKRFNGNGNGSVNNNSNGNSGGHRNHNNQLSKHT